jgi:hypothetical protein
MHENAIYVRGHQLYLPSTDLPPKFVKSGSLGLVSNILLDLDSILGFELPAGACGTLRIVMDETRVFQILGNEPRILGTFT